ncbi:MAG: hypothetical protein A3C07_01800 [Candidatus Sungbacteria bacterium RIFCSPHIGHO2_02_FULL_47_11]|uniref:Antitoxin n=1 Tax=Candidatus Sungbacteria bacterium RIFCSPHIGHO2_02_FULL_47_11 TaxID=1802270 RepID=A0A1G2KLC3_9BACT|nr:MAG: hypothetical protein A3C07_01800 [Candidatus Sungbacteria bacterium RIFCSPHIGHO2_02_FULL_47_11]
MHFDKLKNLVKQNGDKFVVMENGEPEIVMMSFHEYERLMAHRSVVTDLSMTTGKNVYRHEFSDWDERPLEETEFVDSISSETGGLPARLEDIRLEDLPI